MDKIINTLHAAGFSGDADQMLNILIRFDGQMCQETVQKTPPRLAVDRWTMEHLPSEDGVNVTAAKKLSGLLQDRRKYFIIGMRGEEIRAYPLLLRAAVHSRLLSLIANSVPETSWKKEILEFTADVIAEKYTDMAQEIIDEYRSVYAGCDRVLTDDSRKLLKQNLQAFELYAKKIHGCLLQLQGGVPVKAVQPSAVQTETQEAARRIKPTFLNTKERKIRFQCLLEYALQEQEQNRQDWFMPIKNKWNEFIPELVLVDNLAKQVAVAIHRTLPGQISDGEKRKCENPFDRYCLALGVALEEGGIQRIRNESILRNLLMSRTVALYVSYLDSDDLSSDTMENALCEIQSRLSQVSYSAGTSDSEDLKQILALYMEGDRFDPELVQLLSPHRELYKNLFRSTMEFMNSRNQAFQVLSNQLEQIDQYRDAVNFDVRKDLIDTLDRGSHGYCLGRMYRVAIGKECLSPEDTKNLMRSVFYLLENLGIQAVAGDLLDQIIQEDDPIHKLCIPFYNDASQGAHKLIYPGWAINGCQAAPPVYLTEEESN